MTKILSVFVGLFCMTTVGQAQEARSAHQITFEIANYDNDTIIIGNYYANKQLVVDTLYRMGEESRFELVGDESLKPGMYLVLTKPDSEYAQFIVSPDDQTFTMQVDASNMSDISFDGSIENSRFYSYLDYLNDQRQNVDPINKALAEAQESEEDTQQLQAKIDTINEQVNREQQRIIAESPDAIFTRLLKSGLALDVPAFEGSEAEVQMQTYLYYKEHYFDHIDLGDSINLRMPYFHQRIDYYYTKLTPAHPDSIIQTIDYLLAAMEPAQETYRYYLSYFYNDIVRKRMIGMDAVTVHLVDTYYTQGRAEWLSEDSYAKITDNANRLRETLIGKQGKNIILQQEDGTPWELYKDSSEWIVLVFWAPDCGHCTKAMPKILEFSDKYAEQGVKVIGVCTKTGKKYDTCWKGVKDKKMEKLLNLGDQYLKSAYKTKYDVRQTPKTYILDRNKTIRMKDVPADNLDLIMDDIIRVYKEEQLEKS